MAHHPLRVAVFADLLEEGWPSMDLTAAMLVDQLAARHHARIEVGLTRPGFVPVTAWATGRGGGIPTRDRILNRYWLYRRALPGARRRADVFHVLDHSYAHLVNHLPASRTLVTCHDVDALVRHRQGGADSSRLPAFLADRTARGLARAARVVCPSRATADALVDLGVVPAERIAVVPNGVDNPASADSRLEEVANRVLGRSGAFIDLLHVGSTIPRKRIDLLLEVFAAVAAHDTRVRLVRAGGAFTERDTRQIQHLGIAHRLLVLPVLEREELLAVYRRADLLVSTSEREGFCLPVAEALAAGTPVVVPELPVFREVAGDAGEFAADMDPTTWCRTILSLIAERDRGDGRWQERIERAKARGRCFSWATYADAMAAEYEALADRIEKTAEAALPAGAAATR
jgi:glycosyltransferase involved in cell wall biosynthesis